MTSPKHARWSRSRAQPLTRKVRIRDRRRLILRNRAHHIRRSVAERILARIEAGGAGCIDLDDGAAEWSEGGAKVVLGLRAEQSHVLEIDAVQLEIAQVIR